MKLQRQKLEGEEKESQFRVKVMTLETQVSDLTAGREADSREHKARQVWPFSVFEDANHRFLNTSTTR